MIGVIAFSPSPRCIEPDKIREIFDAVPTLFQCCVSHGPSPTEMAALCDLAPDAIQVPPPIPIPASCTARVFRSIRPGDQYQMMPMSLSSMPATGAAGSMTAPMRSR